MNKPGKSRTLLIVGIILEGVGGMVYTSALASSLKASIYPDTSGSLSGIAIGLVIVVIGTICLLAGISRVSAGIDYLVSVAPAPVSAVARREQESRLVREQD